jgi:early secretory antigenic target protein ESAT-6
MGVDGRFAPRPPGVPGSPEGGGRRRADVEGGLVVWFEVDTGELGLARGAVVACAAQVAADVDELGRHLAELRASWQGEAAGAFEVAMARWEAVHEQVRAALGEVGYALEVTGRAYDEAEGSARRLFTD